MPKPNNSIKLTEKQRDRLEKLLSSKGNLREFARLLYPVENSGKQPGESQLRAVVLRLKRILSGDVAFTPRCVNSICAVLGFDRENLLVQLSETSNLLTEHLDGTFIDEPVSGNTRKVRGYSLSPISTVLDPDRANFEFVALMQALFHFEAAIQRCTTLGLSSFSASTTGFGNAIKKGKFCGLDPETNIEVAWILPNDEFSVSREIEELLLEARNDTDPHIKHWIVLTQLPFPQADWKMFVDYLRARGIQAHNFTQPEFEPWLRNCPPLLARYYPHEAAKLEWNHGFIPVRFAKLKDDYVKNDLPRHRELSLIGLPPRFAQRQEKVTVLGEVFVPQKFKKLGSNDSPKTLGDLVNSSESVVLLGDPGSGKTTILHFLALLVSGEVRLPGCSVLPRVALFLPLRDFHKSRRVRPSLLDALNYQAIRRGLKDCHRWFFESLLIMGEAIVLFDGIDEAGSETERAEIADLIEGFRREYPNCPVWVTSRIVGYSKTARLDDKAFVHYSIERFQFPEQKAFISRWYDLHMPNESELREKKKGRFLKAVEKVPGVSRLAGNPLLLTLMALVNHHAGELPRNRGELYQECVEMLLKHWQQARLPESEDSDDRPVLPPEKLEPKIYPAEAKRLLAQVAFDVQVRNENQSQEDARGDIPDGILRDTMEGLRVRAISGRDPTEAELHQYRAKAKEDIKMFLNYIAEGSGLLIWRGGDTWAFAHLSFLEYLAAHQRGEQGIAFSDQAAFFKQKSAFATWREPLVQLLYILANKTNPVSFIGELLTANITKDAPPGFWFALGVAVSDDLIPARSQVRQVLGELLGIWLKEPKFEGDAYTVLSQIAEFAEPQRRDLLLELLGINWNGTGLRKILNSLHLQVRLFGWPMSLPAESARMALVLQSVVDSKSTASSIEKVAEILSDSNIATRSPGKSESACIASVQQQLLSLMTDTSRKARDRTISGEVLGRLGDPRRGAVPKSIEELAEMEFCWIPGDKEQDDFWIARFPVTVAQFRLFATPENYADPRWWQPAEEAGLWKSGELSVTDWNGEIQEKTKGPGFLESRFDFPNKPMVLANWFEAMAWAAWADHELRGILPFGWRLVLPDGELWRRAAQGGEFVPVNPIVVSLNNLSALRPRHVEKPTKSNPFPHRQFPWGEDELGERANWSPTGIERTSSAGCFPNGKSPVGAEEMAGNVWEWAESWSSKERKYRVLRGGSWIDDNPAYLGCAYRNDVHPGYRDGLIGFRCALVGGAAARG